MAGFSGWSFGVSCVVLRIQIHMDPPSFLSLDKGLDPASECGSGSSYLKISAEAEI
jgi:hypothetical protein